VRHLLSITCTSLNILLTFFLTSLPSFLSRDTEEKKEEKNKKRNTSQTTLGPVSAATNILAAPPRATGEEGGHASTDALPTERAAPAPEATEPTSGGDRSEAAEEAPALPASASTTTARGESLIHLRRIYNF
jgi:hypothetical protein